MEIFSSVMADLLRTILQANETKGESEFATKKLGQFLAARYGSIRDSKSKLGQLAAVRDAFKAMQVALYAA